MVKRIYSVYDSKVEAYTQPFFASTDAEATRMIRHVVEDSNSMLSKNPEDFVLFCLGTFDEYNGLVAALEPSLKPVVSIMVLKSFVSNQSFPEATEVAFEGKGLEAN